MVTRPRNFPIIVVVLILLGGTAHGRVFSGILISVVYNVRYSTGRLPCKSQNECGAGICELGIKGGGNSIGVF